MNEVTNSLVWVKYRQRTNPEISFIGISRNKESRQPGIPPNSSVEFYFLFLFIFIYLFLSFCPSRAAPTAYGGLELLLPAYARATAMPDPSRVCNLHHSSWHRWTLNPLSKARDRTRNLMIPSWIRFHCATMGTPHV